MTETLLKPIDIPVRGMTCASCVARVERAIAKVPGVASAAVNLAAERAHVEFGPDGDPDAVAEAIRKAGYEPLEPLAQDAGLDAADRQREARETETRELGRAVSLASLAAAPLFLVEMARHLLGLHFWHGAHAEQTWRVASFALAAFALFGPGLRFYRAGVPALLRAAPDMNSLVVLGASAAFAYSAVATFAPGWLPAGTAHVYYEAAAVIVALILLGRWFEARAKGRTGEAVRKLTALQAKTARVIRDGQAIEVPVSEVRPGDLVEIRPGERIPVDGEVAEGDSYVDEAMISGEPVPVRKVAGDRLIGGAINKAGALRMRATAVGQATMLAQIVRMVEAAQGAKLPIQAQVDKITGWFVPAVIAAALVTFLAWQAFGPAPALGHALVAAVAVLIIACPCAMGLATPTSIMVGTGRAAELGVLFRGGDALQALAGVKAVALDKTGTLTLGRPALTDVEPAAGFAADDILSLAAAVERRSEHPIAQAIVEAAEARGLAVAEVEGFQAAPGRGAEGRVAGRRVQVGAARLMREEGLDAAPFAETARRLADQARTPLYVAVDGRLAGLIAVADPIKPTTPAALARLRALGLAPIMVTGDAGPTAQAVARELGVAEVVAEALPSDKLAAVDAARARFGPVAFVGDGINDAPALAQADVGVAVGAGTDVAIESADVVLLGADLNGVATAVALSRATMANIRQNLAWAFGYNVLLIPLAAGALYPLWGLQLSPMVAAGAMALSSVSVLGNALRLRRFKA